MLVALGSGSLHGWAGLLRASCLLSSAATEATARSLSQASTSDPCTNASPFLLCRLFASATGQRTRKISPAAQAAAAASAARDAVTAASVVTTTPELLAPLERVDPHSVRQQSQFTVDGKRLTGDPGSVRYTAPYYIPEGLRAGMPRVLFTDPWVPFEDAQRRRDHAALVFEHLRSAGTPLTSADVFQRINSSSTTPVFGSADYVKQLLEHMRRTRLVFGQRNPAETRLSHGHPDHPRLYVALPYQQAERGTAASIAQRHAERAKERVELALRRLRNGKPPFLIHRRRARTSAFQYEAAMEMAQMSGILPAATGGPTSIAHA